MLSITDSIYVAARSLVYISGQVIAPVPYVGAEIHLITAMHLATFEQRLARLLDAHAPSLQKQESDSNNNNNCQPSIARILTCELTTQLINQLAPVDVLRGNVHYAAVIPSDEVMNQHRKATVGKKSDGIDFYHYHQDQLILALISAGQHFARLVDPTNLNITLNGAYLNPTRVALLMDFCSWIANVYHQSQGMGGSSTRVRFSHYIQIFFRRLVEFIALKPYCPRDGMCLRWVHRLEPETYNTDRIYMERLKLTPVGRHRASIVALVGTAPEGILLDSIDTETPIMYKPTMNGDCDWSPRANTMMLACSSHLRRRLLPFEGTHDFMFYMLAEQMGSRADGANSRSTTLGIERDINGTNPIAAGISSLWRSNPLVAPRPPALAVPEEMHTRRDVLKQVLDKNKTTTNAAQTDGVAHTHLIAAPLHGKAQSAAAAAIADPVSSFDENAEYKKRADELTRLVGAPLQTKPLPEQDWQKLIAEPVSSSSSTRVRATDTSALVSSGVHAPVSGAPDVKFY